MTQQEFEKRTQFAVNAETFAIINRLYMATDMYKDDFCKEFKAMNDPTSGGNPAIAPRNQHSLRGVGGQKCQPKGIHTAT